MGCSNSQNTYGELKRVDLPNGESLAYREQVALNPVKDKEHIMVFLHATMCSSRMLETGGLLDKLMSVFPQYRIIGFDLRGCGNSSYKTKITKLEDYAEDIGHALEKLQINKCVLLGTCLGGFVSQCVAINHPSRIEKLILVGGFLHVGGAHMFKEDYPKNLEDTKNTNHYKYAKPALESKDKEKLKPVMESFHPKNWVTASHVEELMHEIFMCQNLLECFWGEAIANISTRNNGKVQGNKEITKLKTPLLIIHGEDDGTIPIQQAIDLNQDVPGSKLVKLKAGHFTWYDNLEATVNPMVDFLK